MNQSTASGSSGPAPVPVPAATAPLVASPRREIAAATLFHLALWSALAFGLAEGFWMTWSRLVLGDKTLTGIHVAWLAPATDIAWFVLLGGLLLLGARVLSRRLALAPALGVYLAFGCFTLSLLVKGLHPAAGLMLSIGVAIEGARQVSRREDRVLRVVRITTLPLLALFALVVAGAFGREHLRERRALAAFAGVEAPAGAPNVLLLVLDTVRDIDLSVSGYHRPTTPNLERIAASGVQFTKAWSPSSWTLSSHGSMFTGRYPHELTAGLAVALDATEETIAERLARNGWVTAGFVGNLHYGSRHFGLNRGFQHYEDYVVSPSEALINSSFGRFLVTKPALRDVVGYYDIVGRRRAPSINARLLRWLERSRTRGRPYFAFVNYYDAHEPYEPPDEYERKFASNVPLHRFVTDQSVRGARRLDKQEMTPAEINRLRDNYDASIRYLDDAIGALLDSLRVEGLLENTLVIITSDHGEQFGERGLFVHGNSLYRPVMKVPLIMSMPGRIAPGGDVDVRVNTRNLAATIADITGTAGRKPMPGRSLAMYLDAIPDSVVEHPHLFEAITTRHEKIRSVVWGDVQYIRHEDGREELIALPNDSTLAPETRGYGELIADEPLRQVLAMRMDSILSRTKKDRWAR